MPMNVPGPGSSHAIHQACRQHSGATAATTLAPAFEDRTIVLAQGIEFNNLQNKPETWRMPEFLEKQLGNEIRVSGDRKTAWYKSKEQRVNYTLRITNRKDDLKKWLETDGVVVIYAGHARYGRGPCFGENKAPGQDWGNGSDPAVRGMFRLGFPFLAVPASEVRKHKYTCSPVRADGDKPTLNDCHPTVRACYSKLKPRSLKWFGSDFKDYVSGPPGPDDRFWGFTKRSHGKWARHVVLHAGWENTATTPLDLGATTLRCKAFGHFGCSTYVHNYPIVRERKGWQQTDTDRFSFFLSKVAYNTVPHRFIYHLLTYGRETAFKPEMWASLFRYVVGKVNRELRREGYDFRVVPKKIPGPPEPPLTPKAEEPETPAPEPVPTPVPEPSTPPPEPPRPQPSPKPEASPKPQIAQGPSPAGPAPSVD